METLLIVVGIIALQFILQMWVFPRLGVST
jgi:hypothetical protein